MTTPEPMTPESNVVVATTSEQHTAPVRTPRLSTRRRRGLVLFTVVITIVAVCSVAFTRTDSDRDQAICAAFQNTFGLYPGAAVTIRGIQIGTVDKLTPRGGQVQVDMKIDDRELGAEVGAAIVNSSILTDRRVELVNTEMRDGASHDGTCIPESRTAEPISVPDALNSFSRFFKEITTADESGQAPLQALLAGADHEMAGLGPQINAQLRELGRLMESPDTFMRDFGKLIENSAELADFAAADWENIATTIKTFGPGLSLIEYMLGLVKMIVEKLANALDPLDRLFNQHFPMFMDVLNASVPIVSLVRTKTEQSPELLQRIPAILTMLRTMLEGPGRGVGVDYRAPQAQVASADASRMCVLLKKIPGSRCEAASSKMLTVPLPQLLLADLGGHR
ncbi:MlaD family protein [Gordonia paraffinivorans]|uniref:MlaD family protein n=1 Tax=Gordonia paraffinivorans TaxID=175628 RepID=UPI003FCDD6AB